MSKGWGAQLKLTWKRWGPADLQILKQGRKIYVYIIKRRKTKEKLDTYHESFFLAEHKGEMETDRV